jgi:uncharacterized protein YbaR (Trm112 family)
MPVSSELLEILVCPETKQPVALAGDDVLARVNEKIAAIPVMLIEESIEL